MATGLVKWWRAKCLAGYKPFSVVGGNTEGSDSEELLAGIAPTTGSSPPLSESQPILEQATQLLPPRSTTTTTTAVDGCPVTPNPVPDHEQEQPTSSTTKQLSFEEFECDVSVREGNRRRQEFSFTLYDFDGHGKITKDDIAGLVTTIYDTLGTSIQVPPCGSKTIKVKLTVSPDQRVRQSRNNTSNNTRLGSPQATGTSLHSDSPPCCNLKHNNATCNQQQQQPQNHNHHQHQQQYQHNHNNPTLISHQNHNVHARRVPRRRRAPRHRYQLEHPVETHSEDEAEHLLNSNSKMKQEEVRRRVGPLPHIPSPYSNSSEGDISDDSDTCPEYSPLLPLLRTNQRKRSGALQRQQLLEIIQANMEKNNLSFHTSRKRHQNEQLRSPQVESTMSPQKGRPPSETTPVTAAPPPPPLPPPLMQQLPLQPAAATTTTTTTTSYHKPVRENNHLVVSSPFPKLPNKMRGNLRKTRTQHHGNVQRNLMSNQVTRCGIVPHSPTTTNTSPQSKISSRNNGLSPPMNNEKNLLNVVPNNNQSNTNNRNDAQYLQSPNNKGGKEHQLKHANRKQDQARAMAQVVRWLEREFSQNAAAASTGRRHVHEHIHHHYHHYHAEALV